MPHAAYTYGYAAVDRLRPLFEAPHADWLSPGERRAVARFRNPTRRATWLAGRLLSKRLIASHLARDRSIDASSPPQHCQPGGAASHARQPPDTRGPYQYRDIEIRSAGARPQVSVAGCPQAWSLSIAHTRCGVLAALSCLPGVALGVDLVEPRGLGTGFVELWLTPTERQRLARSDPRWQAVVWALKEAVYKAVNTGAPFDPRRIETAPLLWRPSLLMSAADGRTAGKTGQRGGGVQSLTVEGSIDSCFLSRTATGPSETKGSLAPQKCCLVRLWQTPQEEIAIFAAYCAGGRDRD